MISAFNGNRDVYKRQGKSGFANLDATLAASMELCPQPVLLTDPHGVILQYNQMASNFLKFCNSTSSSLWQLFPEAEMCIRDRGSNVFFAVLPVVSK